MSYAKAFRVLRAVGNHSQKDAAQAIGITASGLSLIEAGKRQPSIERVHAFATFVGVPAAFVSLLATDRQELAVIEQEQLCHFGAALLRFMISAGETDGQ